MGPFELSIRQFIARQGERGDAVARQVVLEVWRRFILRSPVLTGRFRFNWQYAYGSIPTGWVEVPGTPDSPTGPPPEPAITQGYGVHYIANNVPYAWFLENGGSRAKAPSGVVGVTLLEFQGIADDAVKQTSSASQGEVVASTDDRTEPLIRGAP